MQGRVVLVVTVVRPSALHGGDLAPSVIPARQVTPRSPGEASVVTTMEIPVQLCHRRDRSQTAWCAKGRQAPLALDVTARRAQEWPPVLRPQAGKPR